MGVIKLQQILKSPLVLEDEREKASMKHWMILQEPLPMAGKLDPNQVWMGLQQNFPWMRDANQRAAESIAWSQYTGEPIPPFLINGAPGIGKTAWAQALGKLCNIPSKVVSVAGANSLSITGTERVWRSSYASLMAESMRQHRIPNPFLIVDDRGHSALDG